MKSLGKSTETQSKLREAIFRAVDHLESRLSDPPSVADLAEVSGLSKFHFQRAFKLVIGETYSQHARRLRAERGAAMLKSSSWQVGEIALVCGYKSQAGFTRDFTKLFGLSPHRYRKESNGIPFLRAQLRERPDQPFASGSGPLPTVQIEQWPDLTPICLRFYCRVEQLQEAWSETILLLNGHVPNLERARFFGLWFDGWTHPDPEEGNYRYECAILPQDPVKGELPAPVFRRQLPGGLVAVSHAHGSTQQIETHWETFGYGWLPFSGFQPRGEIAGIDEYPADLILASKAKQALALVKGMSMRLNLPIQQEILNY